MYLVRLNDGYYTIVTKMEQLCNLNCSIKKVSPLPEGFTEKEIHVIVQSLGFILL